MSVLLINPREPSGPDDTRIEDDPSRLQSPLVIGPASHSNSIRGEKEVEQLLHR